jgi:hypothetical protein
VVAAQTFTNGFAFVWAGFPDTTFGSFNQSMTYYLYSAGTAPSNSNQADPVSQGTLVLQKNASPPYPADPADRSGAYTITYNPPSGAATAMSFAGGQFVSDTGDIPAIGLSGSFVVKSSLTNDATDDVIIPIVAGQVNGIQVIGTPFQQGGSGKQDKGFFYTFAHPQTFLDYLNVIGASLGVIMGLTFIGSLLHKLRTWWIKSRRQPPRPGDNDLEQELLAEYGEARAAGGRAAARIQMLNASPPAPSAMQEAIAAGRARVVNFNNVVLSDRQMDELRSLSSQAGVVAEFGVTQGLNDISENIRSQAQSLRSGQGQGGQALADAVAAAPQNISGISAALNPLVQQTLSRMTTAQQGDIKSAQADAADAQKGAEQADRVAKDAAAGDGGDDDMAIDGARGGD